MASPDPNMLTLKTTTGDIVEVTYRPDYSEPMDFIHNFDRSMYGFMLNSNFVESSISLRCFDWTPSEDGTNQTEHIDNEQQLIHGDDWHVQNGICWVPNLDTDKIYTLRYRVSPWEKYIRNRPHG